MRVARTDTAKGYPASVVTRLSFRAVALACLLAAHSVGAQTVYVASPLGFAESTRGFMNDVLIPAIAKSGVTPINPWAPNPRIDAQIQAVQAFSDLPSRREAWTRLIDDIGGTNAKSIQRADGVVAVLDGVDVDSGTAAELGYAAALGKWIVGYRGDFRRTGDDETATVNLQVEYFIRRSGGVIVRSLAELDHELRRRARAR